MNDVDLEDTRSPAGGGCGDEEHLPGDGGNHHGRGGNHPPASVEIKHGSCGVEMPLDNDDDDYMDNERSGDLPTVEEYKAQVPRVRARSKMSERRCRRRIIFIILMAIVIIVSVTVGVIVGRETAPGTTATTTTNSESGTGAGGEYESLPSKPHQGLWTRREEVMKLVTELRWSDPLKVNEQDTPQNAAAVWMAEGDGARLAINDTLKFRQRYALAVLFYSLSGHESRGGLYRGKLQWLTAEPECKWRFSRPSEEEEGLNVEYGVRCFGGSVVKEIYLPRTGGTGALGGNGACMFPDEIKLLFDLQLINLSGNNITGTLPTGIDSLSNLKDLDVSSNQLQGTFPEFLGFQTLRTLDLSHNAFHGGFPKYISGLSSLETFSIGYNNFADNIDRLSDLNNVRILDISGNNFTGSLHNGLLGSWQHIQTLDMSDNNIRGPLPDNLFQMDALNIVDLHGNFFNGTLPQEVKSESDLSFLALHENELVGDINIITQSLTQLSHLDLSSNWFNGTMGSFEKMSNLRYLFLAFNSNFERGPIPTSIVSLQNLVDLSLQMTERSEAIPSGFGSNKNLAFFDLGYNYLSGQIPEDLGEASSLQFLLLNRNEGLSGTIPTSFANLAKLSTLLLDRTSLSGPSDPICKNKPASLKDFFADCDEISCPVDTCCTKCCEDGDDNTVTQCNDVAWNGQLDPVAEYKYERSRYNIVKHPVPDMQTYDPPPLPITDAPNQTVPPDEKDENKSFL